MEYIKNVLCGHTLTRALSQGNPGYSLEISLGQEILPLYGCDVPSWKVQVQDTGCSTATLELGREPGIFQLTQLKLGGMIQWGKKKTNTMMSSYAQQGSKRWC